MLDLRTTATLGNADYDTDSEIIIPAYHGTLEVMDIDGQNLPGFPIQISSGIQSVQTAIGDIDGDGDIEIMQLDKNTQDMHAFDLEVPKSERPDWPMARHDERGSCLWTPPQTAGFDILEIRGPLLVMADSSTPYTARAYFEDGSNRDVTLQASWWVDPSDADYAYFESNGTLVAKSIDLFQDIIIHAEYTEGDFFQTASYAVRVRPLVQILYVDDDAVNDPGPNDPTISDPCEKGTEQHPFDTIQEAADVAGDGDTVIVLPGDYYENIDFDGKNFTLTSTEPASETIVKATRIYPESEYAIITSGGNILGLSILGNGSGIRWRLDTNHTNSPPVIKNCRIIVTGYGIRVSASPQYETKYAVIENNIIAGNRCIYLYGSGGFQGVIRNNILTSSGGDNTGSGIIYAAHASVPSVYNNIIINLNCGLSLWFDTKLEQRIARVYYNNVYNNTENYRIGSPSTPLDLTGVNGNMSIDPLFVDAANGDFHLRPMSPCINAGDPEGNYDGIIDIDGEPRVIEGRVDIGADEFAYQSENLITLEIIAPDEIRENSSVQFTAVAYDEDHVGINVSSSALWSLEPDEYGSFDGHGVLTSKRLADVEQVAVYAEYLAGEVVLEAATVVQVAVPSSVVVTGAEKIGENISEQYTATAYYEDGSVTDVTSLVNWSIEPEQNGSFDANGLLTTGSINNCEEMTVSAHYTIGGVAVEGQMTVQLALPVSLKITGTLDIPENSQAQYKATVYYDNTAVVDVTDLADWWIEPEDVGDITAGLLQANYLDETQVIIIHCQYGECERTVSAKIGVQIYSFEIWHVPADYDTIQEAIDAAVEPDLIIVDDGVYTGEGNRDIDFKGKAITVRSANGPDTCIIDCEGTEADPHRGFYFHSGEYDRSVLEGITITNGYAYGDSDNRHGGGAIRCDNSSPTIRNCRFVRNFAAWDGGAINNLNSNPKITNCEFVENSAIANDGGGMNNYDNSYPIITNCIFRGNKSFDWGGAIRNISSSSPMIINCLFTGNQAGGTGAGVFNYNSCRSKIVNCTFAGNSAPKANAIGSDSQWFKPNTITVTNCIIWDGWNGVWNGEDSAMSITHSNVQGGWSGTGNIQVDPLFFDPVGGDCRLFPASPCINAGNPNYEPIPNETDLDGNTRVVGGRIDMGAYESDYIEFPMKFTPQTLNLESKGKWVKAHFVLPQGFGIADVDVSVPATLYPLRIISDHIDVSISEEGFVKIDIAFNRSDFCGIANASNSIEVMVVGLLNSGQRFYGTDTIRIVINRMQHIVNLAAHWLEDGCGKPDWCNGTDLNHDSVVDLNDFGLVETNGKTTE